MWGRGAMIRCGNRSMAFFDGGVASFDDCGETKGDLGIAGGARHGF